jgi:protein-tyrosine phosphatase
MNILFICKGNINRSAIAEYILKHQLKDLINIGAVDVKSSGTTAAFGSWGAKATVKMREVAIENKIPDLDLHRAQLTTPELLDWADVAYYMDKKNERKLKRMFDEEYFNEKCKQLCDIEVPDPMGGEKADFDVAFKLIFDKCSEISHEIRHSLKRR